MVHKTKPPLPGAQTRGGSKNGKLGGTSSSEIYSLPTISAMPSVERSGSIARVVSCGGKLFAVGYYAGGAL